MPEIDPLIHAPARLQLVAALSAVSEAEFATLRDLLAVSDSVMSKHVSALVDAGYLRSRKGMRAGRRTTWVALTATGRTALDDHVAALRRLIDAVEPGPADRPAAHQSVAPRRRSAAVLD